MGGGMGLRGGNNNEFKQLKEHFFGFNDHFITFNV